MNNDVVIIPTYDRPEYLWVCLEKLSKARGVQNKEVWICEDNHSYAPKHFTTQVEMLATIREAERVFGISNIVYRGLPPHSFYGNSYNVFSALQSAYDRASSFVYIVEDDAMVLPDFFEWHEAAQTKWQPFVTCAGRINRSLNFEINGPEAIDETIKNTSACVRSRKAYMSWATCFKRESLYWILKHVPEGEDFQPGFEQDIFIQNFIRDGHEASIWPFVPRAYHMGWYSYHRTAGMKFNGTLEDKVSALRKTIINPSKIKEMAGLQEIDAYPKEPLAHSNLEDLYLQVDYK
jgi:hypothetical protein